MRYRLGVRAQRAEVHSPILDRLRAHNLERHRVEVVEDGGGVGYQEIAPILRERNVYADLRAGRVASARACARTRAHVACIGAGGRHAVLTYAIPQPSFIALGAG